jgi:lysophospholipase L1-like esterase
MRRQPRPRFALHWGKALIAVGLLASAEQGRAQQIARVPSEPAGLGALPMRVTGRAVALPGGGIVRQWPGTYAETAFRGGELFFRVGPGQVSLRVSIDGQPATSLVRPMPGSYRIAGLPRGDHRVRIDVASESQAGPTTFGGFFAATGMRGLAMPPRARRIEFIGDSHTVGYGNLSPVRACTEDQVWSTTDTTRGLAAITARRFGADYEVNAISGRGVVRNYGGFKADTLPEAYPFALFDHDRRVDADAWHPQAIVIALGTNDFSTALKPGERWSTREQLHADFERSYVRFVQGLRARDPYALIVIWATDLADGEIEAEAGSVVRQLVAAGDTRVVFVPVHGLAFTACNSHPSTADDARIADAIAAALQAHPGIWNDR